MLAMLPGVVNKMLEVAESLLTKSSDKLKTRQQKIHCLKDEKKEWRERTPH